MTRGATNDPGFMLNALARVGHNNPPDLPPDGALAARGRAKYRAALKDLPAHYKEPDSYETLEAWLAANPSPRQWARSKARELLAESARFRELGMSLGEATHWLAEHAHKWKRIVEERQTQ